MEILNLSASKLNQNNYNKNSLTSEFVGSLVVYPIAFTHENCLACNGYTLKKTDYEELYSVIGTKFNNGTESNDEFSIPDYNVSGRFLQPGMNVGNLIAAGLPQHTHSGTTSSNGDHTHTRGSMEIWGNVSFYGVEAWYGGGAGAFYVSVDNATSISHHSGGQEKIPTLNFNASRHWTGSTSINGAHTHTMTTGNASNIIYGNSTTVQPPSQLVHICIRYK